MRAVCLFCGCGERILAVRGTGWGPPSQEGGAPRFALGRRTPQGSLLTPAGAELRDSRLAGQRWPGPARSEKLRLLRGAVGAAQVLGTTVLGTHREKGSSQDTGAGCTVARASYERPNSAPRRLSRGWGAAVLSPNLPGGRGQRVRDIHLASPPGGRAGGPHPEVVPTASSQVAADTARSRSTLRQGASSHRRPDRARQPPNEPVRGRSPATGRLRPACPRLSSRRLRARLCRRGRAPFEGQWATRAKSARCRLGCGGLGKGP